MRVNVQQGREDINGAAGLVQVGQPLGRFGFDSEVGPWRKSMFGNRNWH
jgi:hypothetical protein